MRRGCGDRRLACGRDPLFLGCVSYNFVFDFGQYKTKM
jgi:hypothetical protein